MALLVLLISPLLILVFFFLLFNTQKKLVKKSLNPPPGPSGLPFIGNLHQFCSNAAAPHIYLWKLSKKHGPLMSMKLGSVPLVVISSPEIAKQVMKTNDLAFCSRPKVLGQYKISYNGSDIAFAPYSETWRELRKICVLHLLSNKQLHSFRPVREEEVFRMIKNLSLLSDNNSVVNLTVLMLSLTSTLICRIAFGRINDEEESRKRRFDELMIEAQAMQGGFYVSDYLPSFGWMDKLSGMIDRLDRVFKDLDEFFEGLIEEHLDQTGVKSVTDNPNILDLLIQLKEEKSSSIDLTWDHVKATIMDIFIAGTDTGAATIIWTMTALMQNPKSMKKLQNEIRDSIGGKGRVDEDDLHNLPYLKATVKEVLRLYPPAPLLIPRETIEECEIEGHVIHPKTLVYVNAWAIARDPDHWERPDEFAPERFLNSSVDIVGQDFQVIPFGSGRRGCPGISMGLATVELAVANLVYSFEWGLPEGMNKEDIDTDVLPGVTMHKKLPLCLVPTKYVYSISNY
ncbi:hypothetical protein ABFS83_12G162200 [Erythranthe nasuta]